MKFYSEITGYLYESEKDLINAENEYKTKKEAEELDKKREADLRRSRAEEVEKARQIYVEARKNYNDILTAFCKDYGAYHCSIKNNSKNSLVDHIDSMLHLF